jgi:hypothetical protein
MRPTIQTMPTASSKRPNTHSDSCESGKNDDQPRRWDAKGGITHGEAGRFAAAVLRVAASARQEASRGCPWSNRMRRDSG